MLLHTNDLDVGN